MSIQDEWLAEFRAIVQHEIDAAGGRKRDGYRAVAAKTHLNTEYVYQVFAGKPTGKPKVPGQDAMDRIRKHYPDIAKRHTAPATYTHSSEQAQAATLREAKPLRTDSGRLKVLTTEDAFATLALQLNGLDETARRQAASVLSNLVDDPASSARLATIFGVIVATGKRQAA